MPELPEVEHAARQLRQAAVGRTIARVQALHPSLARSLTPAACRRLVGRQITEVTRRAKMQLVTLDDGHVLEVHFRMTGDWAFGRDGDPPPPQERARFTLTDGTRISLTDARALGVLRLHPPGALQLPVLGPEPLDDGFTVDALREALASRRAPIKPTMLDQRVVAGLGNIYAVEALWVARVHPTRVAASLSRARVAALRDAIREVLNAATVGRYYARDGADRADESAWRVYGREGEACSRCARPIRRITQSGRSTYYCGACQR
ncbi:MAG: bifunctional DNA-formamidopyrimidine glycosylase/DNA-(apurinic or apyrimidinic site) lyase [Gemmatimonas sp.]